MYVFECCNSCVSRRILGLQIKCIQIKTSKDETEKASVTKQLE